MRNSRFDSDTGRTSPSQALSIHWSFVLTVSLCPIDCTATVVCLLGVDTRSAQLSSFLLSHMTMGWFPPNLLCYLSPSLHQNLDMGGDSLSESTNHMLPPPTTSLGNLSSLDITNDEELPTDPSNSSDTQEESECCFVIWPTQEPGRYLFVIEDRKY